MWIVRLALRRPYTFVVAAMLIAILGIYMIVARMPTDIFPQIDIPVVSVIFNYTGMSAEDMERRIVSSFEKITTTTVNDIEHIESQSLNGIGVVKIYFQPNAKIEVAIAQVTAISQTAIRQMPTGTTPPLVIQYNASDVPIMQLSIGSETIPEQRLFDVATNDVRTKLVTIKGIEVPAPYGGKQRNIIVDLDPEKLYAYGISPSDVSSALNAQNLILPSGNVKIGTQEYAVVLNSSPEAVEAINALPIKSVNGATVYIRDVSHVRDGYAVQTNIVHADGKRGVLISILKSGNTSTLAVVYAVKARLPEIVAGLAPDLKDLKISVLFDQSVFVRASVNGVVKEAAIAAGLTALMILLFLGSWRSTLIVIVSIPLSILVSIIILGLMGETLNIMTLGGMALAVGILVDDATVAIENIHRNLHQRKGLVQAILDGSQQIAVPAFVSTICICIVFVPVVFISGAARFLFTPLAMAVVFAMLTSYVLSRTLVPTMIHYLLPAEIGMYGGVEEGAGVGATSGRGNRGNWWFLGGLGIVMLVGVGGAVATGMVPPMGTGIAASVGQWIIGHGRLIGLVSFGTAGVLCLIYLFVLIHPAFNFVFEKFRRFYGGLLDWSLDHRIAVCGGFFILVTGSCFLFPIVGRDFFPSVDAGQLRLHVRCPPGTRIEQTEQYFAEVEDAIRKIIPQAEMTTMLDNMGIPYSGINLSLSDGSVMSPADGEILIALSENHRPTAEYMRTLRKELPRQFPDIGFFFAPPDIVTQVLNFGLSAPVDIQIAGSLRNEEKNLAIIQTLRQEVRVIPGVVDVHMQQVPTTPDLRVTVDRTLASMVGVTQRDVASDLLISLSSSNQTAPNFWLNPQNGVNYSIYVQTPQYRMETLNSLDNTPIVPASANGLADTQLLENLATVTRQSSATNITHYQIDPTYDLLLGVQGTDLGTAADKLQAAVDRVKPQLPPGSTITLRGQVQSMKDSFTGLAIGLVFAVVLVYLLMVINFQSWLDPMIILGALPGALAGILWMLWASNTTISVPALMGAIMSIGVATANSILMITFANDQRELGMNARTAALAAGLTRLRPVMMTALAMIIGMLPMALGLGEGGEQNAPLGRAVIGGLSMATFATLFFVPVLYSLLRGKPRKAPLDLEHH